MHAGYISQADRAEQEIQLGLEIGEHVERVKHFLALQKKFGPRVKPVEPRRPEESIYAAAHRMFRAR